MFEFNDTKVYLNSVTLMLIIVNERHILLMFGMIADDRDTQGLYVYMVCMV